MHEPGSNPRPCDSVQPSDRVGEPASPTTTPVPRISHCTARSGRAAPRLYNALHEPSEGSLRPVLIGCLVRATSVQYPVSRVKNRRGKTVLLRTPSPIHRITQNSSS
ncbi:hypothetical protein PV326_011776 [Microctonus aethiopoides]|nr:hypothetical protein PV326_011776 [Microctonus aethiopoides]